MSIKYRKNAKIIDTKIDEEVVMMNTESGHYYGLDDIGSIIWDMLESPLSEDEIVIQLSQQFDVTKEQCAQDIAPFLQNLLNAGMLEKIE